MKTAIKDMNNLHTTDEQTSDKQTWQTPVLKVLPVERARKAPSGVPDGPVYNS